MDQNKERVNAETQPPPVQGRGGREKGNYAPASIRPAVGCIARCTATFHAHAQLGVLTFWLVGDLRSSTRLAENLRCERQLRLARASLLGDAAGCSPVIDREMLGARTTTSVLIGGFCRQGLPLPFFPDAAAGERERDLRRPRGAFFLSGHNAYVAGTRTRCLLGKSHFLFYIYLPVPKKTHQYTLRII